MGWTIFTVVDLLVGLLLIDLMTTAVPPEKLPRIRRARNAALVLLALSVMVLLAQIAHRHSVAAR